MGVDPKTDKVIFVEIFISHSTRIPSTLNKGKEGIIPRSLAHNLLSTLSALTDNKPAYTYEF